MEKADHGLGIVPLETDNILPSVRFHKSRTFQKLNSSNK